MAKYVSKKSEARWNHTAKIVEAGGAGSRRVPQPYRDPRGESTGGSDTVIVIARATADVTASSKTFSAKIKATIAGDPQTFDETITVENLAPGDYTTPTVTGNYIPTTTDNVFLLLEGMNFIAVKSNTDSTSWPYSSAEKTGWFILQAPGVFT
jgi:hypothetical protein